MQTLVKKCRETATIKNNEVIDNHHVGGIKVVYKVIKPGKFILWRRWGDKVLGEYVFLKPLREWLDETLFVKKAKTKSLMCNTWLLLNADYTDIQNPNKILSAIGYVEGQSLIQALNRNVSEITIEDADIKLLN